MLGILCSRVGGKFWGDQLRARVFVPLGMASRVISERDIVPGRAAGYDFVDGQLKNQQWVAPSQNTTADGSLYVTAQDMARWSIALDGEQLLSQAEKRLMWKSGVLKNGQPTHYGFGWDLSSKAGHRIVSHEGGWQGFTTYLIHFPDDRLTITVLMNRSNAHPQEIAGRVAARFLPWLWKPPADTPSSTALARTALLVHRSTRVGEIASPLVEVEPRVFQTRLTLNRGVTQFNIGNAASKLTTLGGRFNQALVTPGQPQTLEFHGGDLFLPVDTPGIYLFRLDLHGEQAPVLTVTLAPKKVR